MEGNTQPDEAALLAGEEAALLAGQLQLEKLDLNDICNVVAYSVMSLGRYSGTSIFQHGFLRTRIKAQGSQMRQLA